MRVLIVELVLILLEPPMNADFPAHRHIFELFRLAILSRQLQGGSKLPSSRNLAKEIKCSRNTIIAAYEQLLVDGYVESRIGSGTVVTDTLPNYAIKTHLDTLRQSAYVLNPVSRILSKRGNKLTQSPSDKNQEIQGFIAGLMISRYFPISCGESCKTNYHLWLSGLIPVPVCS